MTPWTIEVRWWLDILWDAERELRAATGARKETWQEEGLPSGRVEHEETYLRLRKLDLVCQIIDLFLHGAKM